METKQSKCTNVFLVIADSFKVSLDIEWEIQGVFCNVLAVLLPTAREDNVFTGICHSVHNRSYGYSVAGNPCYGAVSMHPTGMISCDIYVFINDIFLRANT